MRAYFQDQRDNYTTKEMIREYERSAQRQREIRQRGVLRGSLDRRLIPEERKCNIDDWNLTMVRSFNVGELHAICYHCKAESFAKENKGKDLERQNIYFGKLCCNKGKCNLPLFPEIPWRLRELYTS